MASLWDGAATAMQDDPNDPNKLKAAQPPINDMTAAMGGTQPAQAAPPPIGAATTAMGGTQAAPVTNTMQAPSDPAPTAQAAPAGQPWYGQQDVDWFQQQAQSRYGRQATPQELAQIGQNSTSRDSALSYADTLARQQGWQGPAATTPAQPAAPAVGPAAPPPAQVPIAAGNGQTAGTDPMRQQVQDTLGRLMAQGDTVDPNSPAMVQQRDAFRRTQGRGIEQAKRAAAERGASSGTSGAGGFEAGMQGIDMAAAQGEGDFEASMMTRELEGQRDRMMAGLQLAQQSGQTDQARGLQERLASISAQLQQRGQDMGYAQGNRGQDIGYNLGLGGLDVQRQGQQIQGRLGQGDLDLRRLLGLGQLDLGRQQMGNQNEQFYSGLGAQLGMNNANMNQQALLALLNG